ncbi:MAG: type II toxin-antitoxin system RelE/ParE family toxin [Prosthecobacter sp.]|jgi:plasmid stabilization system protein ParE|nr:type II toxin-antitoxin system RelE/ParE family toxin [Prosthecobacter sp.]
MKHEVVLLRSAEDDIFFHFTQYEDQSEGRGFRFDADLEAAKDLLADFPQIGSRFLGEVRKYLLLRWNLGVFYHVVGRRVIISAVLDLRQDPGRLLQILRSRQPI